MANLALTASVVLTALHIVFPCLPASHPFKGHVFCFADHHRPADRLQPLPISLSAPYSAPLALAPAPRQEWRWCRADGDGARHSEEQKGPPSGINECRRTAPEAVGCERVKGRDGWTDMKQAGMCSRYFPFFLSVWFLLFLSRRLSISTFSDQCCSLLSMGTSPSSLVEY